MSTASPPRPPRDGPGAAGFVHRDDVEALVEALIEEARQRARRRRRRNTALILLLGLAVIGTYAAIARVTGGNGPATAAPTAPAGAPRSGPRNGTLAIYLPSGGRIAKGDVSWIETVGQGTPRRLWSCPGDNWCGQAVSFAWAPDGRRIAFSLDEIGGNVGYVGLHVVDLVTGRDRQIPGGAPKALDGPAGRSYVSKMARQLGCWPPSQLAWSPDGAHLAYPCGARSAQADRFFIAVLPLDGARYRPLATKTPAAWPSWSPDGKHLVYATGVRLKDDPVLYSIGIDGTGRKLLVAGGTAPAWSPDGRTIAYQTRCGIRLVTPTGLDATPRAGRNACGAIGLSGPPVWSPDGTKLAVATDDGVYVLDADGRNLHRISTKATRTWYGGLAGRPSWQPLP